MSNKEREIPTEIPNDETVAALDKLEKTSHRNGVFLCYSIYMGNGILYYHKTELLFKLIIFIINVRMIITCIISSRRNGLSKFFC